VTNIHLKTLLFILITALGYGHGPSTGYGNGWGDGRGCDFLLLEYGPQSGYGAGDGSGFVI
jgi:hypothetical protein